MSVDHPDQGEREIRFQIAASAYHSNPFWSDPTDPQDDPAITEALRQREEIRLEILEQNRERDRLNMEILAANAAAVEAFEPRDFSNERNILIALGVLAGVFMVLSVGTQSIAPDTGISDLLALPLGLACIAIPVVGVLWMILKWRDRPQKLPTWEPVHYDARRSLPIYLVEEASFNRYRDFLGEIFQADPGLYSQIVLWEQQQELIRLQRDSNDQQERIIDNQHRILQSQDEASRAVSRAIDRQTKIIEREAQSHRQWRDSMFYRQ